MNSIKNIKEIKNLSELHGSPYHLTEEQKKILKAAKDTIIETGFPRTSLRKIAERAGLPLATVTASYKTKEVLLGVLAEQYMSHMTDAIEQDVQPSPELLRDHPKEMEALYQYIVLMAIELDSLESDAIIWSLYKTIYTTPELFEHMVERQASYAYPTFAGRFTSKECYERILFLRSSMEGYIMTYGFRKPVEREKLKNSLLEGALRAFKGPEECIKKLVKELHYQERYLVEVGRKTLVEL